MILLDPERWKKAFPKRVFPHEQEFLGDSLTLALPILNNEGLLVLPEWRWFTLDRAAIQTWCLSFPGVTEDVKWESNLVFSVGKKMFAVMDVTDPTGLSFKVDPEFFYVLTEMENICAAPYLGRYKWVKLAHLDVLPSDKLQNLLAQAYHMVFEKLPKKVKVQITAEAS